MTPTFLRAKNLRFVVYPKDHAPPHIHVIGPDAEAKFVIETLKCTYSWGFSEKALREIGDFLKGKKKFLQEAWDDYQE